MRRPDEAFLAACGGFFARGGTYIAPHVHATREASEQPSPLGRGWPAAGAFTSRGGPGEGSLAGTGTIAAGLARNDTIGKRS